MLFRWIKYCLLLGILFPVLHVNGQIVIQNNVSLEQLVAELEGTGLEISNITTDCNSDADIPYGRYQDTSGVTGLNEGLLLTTGAADIAVGPNNGTGRGVNNVEEEQFDPDLMKLIDTTLSDGRFYDVCKVEFDIAIYSNQLSFNYVFGSEEYPEFVGSYHDVFGFFISGPGIPDTTNIALIPGTTSPVSVSTVNHLTNTNYYVANGNGALPPFVGPMQYDGFTRLLEARIEVQPCEKYHIKLIIADEGDGIFDSGIFLEAGSFKGSDEKITTSLEHEQYGNALEGCNDGYFVFHRIGLETQDMSQPVVVNYLIGGSAKNGVDYALIPDSIVIPAFQDSAVLIIQPFEDSLVDPGETVEIFVLNYCPALPPIFKAVHVIEEEFEFNLPDQPVCKGEEVQLNNPVGSLGYDIVWDDLDILSCSNCTSPFASPDTSMSVSYTVTDKFTGCSTDGSINVVIQPLPIVDFSYMNDDDYTNLDVFFLNYSSNANEFHWDFGDGDSSNLINPMHVYHLPEFGNQVEYEVELIAINSITGCKNSHLDTIRIEKPFYLPNIITPNGDMMNDEFAITGIQPDRWNIRVYNRWGKMVFNADQYNNRWSGDDLPDGTYFFDLANVNQDKMFRGYLQIVR